MRKIQLQVTHGNALDTPLDIQGNKVPFLLLALNIIHEYWASRFGFVGGFGASLPCSYTG